MVSRKFLPLVFFISCASLFGGVGLPSKFTAEEFELPDKKNTSTFICPPLNKTADAAFPVGFPQRLKFGRFAHLKGEPFITQDFWADAADNRRVFFLRHKEPGFPSMVKLRDWIRSRPHPITLVMNNQVDRSWPVRLSDKDSPSNNYELILNEPNLHAVYAGNARRLRKYPKLKPLPIGLKWQYSKRLLFGENKMKNTRLYAKVASTSAERTEELFKSGNRTLTVWARPMKNSNGRNRNYDKSNSALTMARSKIGAVINASAPQSVVLASMKRRMSQKEYFAELKKHRFLISPAGNGLDTHSTWEALLVGCIPIVPRSDLDSLFDDLPVWLVSSWDEVTDEAVRKVSKEMEGKKYNWEKVFAQYWKKEIYTGMCEIPNEK